ncbi:VIT family protein [Demequina sp. B12]|uniref:VIT1/CCC1 transporter family protein n=1 Tax=Demequina sp. B12 TaxID=2992757 RepID=UPI00237B5ED6|nr:VIT family protein [Demequina sp. B12]MDE0572724.1 VIT family protein [Demequina sp. B12]
MSTTDHHNIDEEAVTRRLNALRAGVLGANDGIVSTAGLVIGVAAATPDNHGAILAAGVAGVVAGALSMGVGEYVSVSSQSDAEKSQLRREARWHKERPEWELEQLVQLNVETGMSEETARKAAEEQTAHDPLGIHSRMHLGIDPEEITNPWHAAWASLCAFTLGGLLPLLTILLVPTSAQVPATYIAVLIAVSLTGYTSSRLAHSPRTRAIIRNIVGGALAMGITWGIGALIGTAI